jgi:hypothetical protein
VSGYNDADEEIVRLDDVITDLSGIKYAIYQVTVIDPDVVRVVVDVAL